MNGYQLQKDRIESENIEFVDFRVVDLQGRFRHLTIPSVRFTEELLSEGIGFDGSNFGYRNVSGSDMVLIPDLDTAYVETRDGQRILTVIADICDARSRAPAAIDPPGIASAATRYMRGEGIADRVLVSPEFEFYVFDDVRYETDNGRSCAEIESVEGCEHRDSTILCPTSSSAYHVPLPQDRMFGLRCEMVCELEAAGIPVKYHHHEVGPYGQQEIELGFDGLVRMADVVLIAKSIVRNVADDAGYTATFLPKPLFGEPGNGMHLHQYLIRGEKNVFRGQDGLSDLALCYVGGLLTHGRSLFALTNPSTNSYRRLVPGYEAPVHLVYGSANRSAAIRVPAYARDEKMRMELRTMDATCNPYLAFAAILMAGLDGITNGRNARDLGFGPCDTDLYEKNQGEAAPRSLGEALDALECDHEYLLAGGVFNEQTIEQWVRAKREEAAGVSARPHPHEFTLYYDL